MKRVLLHICCGVCAIQSIARLKDQGYQPEGFFYNPNIFPREEYAKRLETAKAVAGLAQCVLHEGDYDQQNWIKRVKTFEQDPEGGQRCTICFTMRLEKTFETAKRLGFDHFTSTLSISPYKSTQTINAVGRSIGDSFLECDFKSDNGFKKTIDAAKAGGLYRQNYCGCRYSRRSVTVGKNGKDKDI